MPPRWFYPLDPVLDPALLPAVREGAAWGLHAGRYYLLGGFDAAYGATTSVYSYSPLDNAWVTHDPITPAIAQYLAIASVGDWIYFTGPLGSFHRYNPATGVSEALTASGIGDEHPLVARGSSIYHGVTTPQPRVYDTMVGAWSDTPGVTPFVSPAPLPGLMADGSTIIVSTQVGATTVVRRWTPLTGAWSDLPTAAVDRWQPSLVRYRGTLYLIGGVASDGVSPQPGFATLEAGAPSWTESPDGDLAAWANGVLVGDRFVAAGGYDHVALAPTDTIALYGQPLHVLGASASVELPIATNVVLLSVSASVQGGPGRRLDLLVSSHTGAQRSVNLPIVVSTRDEALVAITDHSDFDPLDETIIIPPGGA
ncbi:MAG: hypothetical protein H0U69_03365 [Trueperaceae bacterium]|nr:hypothetical protein [Trueperaceae bacterium]